MNEKYVYFPTIKNNGIPNKIVLLQKNKTNEKYIILIKMRKIFRLKINLPAWVVACA